ncbi:odorant receptor coreceptor-like isoform X1 [Adelges cooleyi]|uniref:odorant receptor coreceptor-like isoform X1 n=1 Tax=Adelges cooleyi TaxID=133065 RepID=UPI00217F3F72|nr:odorant receptor coreceptor-like isoform X1 [Adelges cooleyi]
MTKTFVAVLLINLKYPFLYYMFFIAYACPVFLVHLINVMCLVSQHSYEDVNRELGELKNLKSKTERVFRLRSLMNDHWFLEDYIELVSKTFGSKLLLTILDIYIQLLLCLYYAIWDSIVHGLHDILLHGVLNIVILMGNLIYLCYRGHSTVKESRRVIYQLRHLRDLLYDDPVCQAILKIFTLRVNCRKVQVTAAKFFDINLSLLFGSAGIVLTYFLVLIQFQIEGSKHTSAAMNISEVVTVKCKSWPCIIKDE